MGRPGPGRIHQLLVLTLGSILTASDTVLCILFTRGGYVIDTVTMTCYRVVTSPALDWMEARVACKDRNEKLVTLEPTEKAQFVKDFLNAGTLSTGLSIGASRPEGKWDTLFPSTGPDFVWESGQAMNMTATKPFWQADRPSNEDVLCNVVWMTNQKNFLWDDTLHTIKRGYICEKPFM